MIFSKKSLRVVTSTLIIYGAFFLRAFSFILLLPLFTRVIDPETWGGILAAQALAVWLVILMDFGFSLSLARKLAVDRDKMEAVRTDVGDVYSAKLFLIIPAALICWLFAGVGILSHFPELAWWGLAYAISQGFSPIWYYQATERMYDFSLIDIAGRIIYIGLAVSLIKSNSDAYVIMLLQTITSLFITIITIRQLKKDIGTIPLTVSGGVRAIRDGAALSAFSLITSVYTTASTVIFGLFVSPFQVAVYGNADRLVRSGISLLGPLNQILLPKSARAFATGKSKGLILAKKFFLIYMSVGLIGLMAGWFLTPTVVNLLFGSEYAQTAIYLRWLLILFPLTAVNTVIVSHVLIPNNKDSIVTWIYTTISIISLALIVTLVPRFGTQGMVYAMLVPEIMALSILTAYFLKFTNLFKKIID